MQWESPACDGGVGIYNYTLTETGITTLILLSNGPLMAALTLSYNEMHMVSITASNCVGESTASVVTVHEGTCTCMQIFTNLRVSTSCNNHIFFNKHMIFSFLTIIY